MLKCIIIDVCILLLIIAAMNALQILSSPVKADSVDSFITVLPPTNESCFGDRFRWISRKMFVR